MTQPPAAEAAAPPALIAMPGEHPWPELDEPASDAPPPAVDELGNPL